MVELDNTCLFDTILDAVIIITTVEHQEAFLSWQVVVIVESKCF